jgi:hypothetical protein
MSLKAFHIIFITASSGLAFGCGVWALKDFFSADGRALSLVFALGSFAAGVGLIFYGRYFLKKLKDVSFL